MRPTVAELSAVSKICFVGAGNMAEALVKGIIKAQAAVPAQVHVSDPRRQRRDWLESQYGVQAFEGNRDACAGADVIVLAVKPQIMDSVLEDLQPTVGANALVISVAAGRSIASIESRLDANARVVRAMPNVAAVVAQGATGLSAGTHASASDMQMARRIFESVGLVRVVEERLMDAVTGLSGSGPAFIFLIIEALSDAGVKVGLNRWDAHALACQTVAGAAQLVIETEEHTGRLKDMVCSPGGTAIAAIHTLEQGGLRTTLINAVEVATRRAHELGKNGSPEAET